ncbi:hypothetical protein Zmor_027511 [Zophobas morio]|uniref:Uncharacterized protein n=1 Tax=Zophobas morio TaxID=2755281 RepID=A0AA38HNG2_9CUCU|nr:hypothetical protein Zmor_027511 [Zophobas morio]
MSFLEKGRVFSPLNVFSIHYDTCNAFAEDAKCNPRQIITVCGVAIDGEASAGQRLGWIVVLGRQEGLRCQAAWRQPAELAMCLLPPY